MKRVSMSETWSTTEKIVEQMSLEQEKFLPNVLYRDNAMIARDLIFLSIYTTSKTKKNRKEVVKRTFDEEIHFPSFLTYRCYLLARTAHLRRIIEANNVRTRRSNKFRSWRVKIKNQEPTKALFFLLASLLAFPTYEVHAGINDSFFVRFMTKQHSSLPL